MPHDIQGLGVLGCQQLQGDFACLGQTSIQPDDLTIEFGSKRPLGRRWPELFHKIDNPQTWGILSDRIIRKPNPYHKLRRMVHGPH